MKRPKAAAALVYEEIAGIYQQGGPELTTDEKKALLKEYADGWQQRNPSMALVGVYYHEDEEGKDPHLHIDYVPVGTGYQRGPKVQNCLERACNAMGYKSMGASASAQIQWQGAENDFLQKLCETHDIEVLRPKTGKKSRHKSTAQYKLEQRLKEAEAKLKDMEAKVKEVEEKNAKLEERNAELEEMTDGFLPKLVYGRAKKRQANAEKAADEADARRVEAETQRDEAEKQAEEARQSVQDAQEALHDIDEQLRKKRAEIDGLRREGGITDREMVDALHEVSSRLKKAGQPSLLDVVERQAKRNRALWDMDLDAIIEDSVKRTQEQQRGMGQSKSHQQTDELTM